MSGVVMGFLLSKLVDEFYESAKKQAIDIVEKERLNDTVKSHYEKWAENRKMAPVREDLDLGGIAQYIDEGFVQELFSCCSELSKTKFEESYRTILEKLYDYSKANTKSKKYYARQFAEMSKDIVENIAISYVDANTRIAIKYGSNCGQEKSDIKPSFKGPAKNTLAESVKRQKRKIRNQPLISSVPERVSFGALFEKNDPEKRLYIDSPVSMRKSLTKYGSMHELFKDKKGQNILVTGPAGSGKSTGLKAVFLINNSGTEVYYATVNEYLRKESRSEMVRVMRAIVDGKLASDNTLIILDGLDEAFPDQLGEAITFIESILQSDAHIWIGCRENYYSKIAVSLKENFDDIAAMEKWGKSLAKQFMTNYADTYDDSPIKERIDLFVKNIADDQFIISNPFFLTLFLFAIDQPDDYVIPKNEYELLSLFLDRWIEAERIRGTTSIENETFFNQLYVIANQLYSGGEPTVEAIDDAVQGLLICRKTKISAFLHWDFCVYLISRQIIEATLEGDEAIVAYYPQAFLDDVTNMTWDYLESLHSSRLQKMYENLFNVYKQIYEPHETILSQRAQEQILGMGEMKKLKLKDEIIYFSLRLPTVDVSAFFDYASENTRVNHPILELGLAYGIGMRKSHPFALAFAKKLRPKNPEALLNRSWTVAYFGDQPAPNIYEFEENPVASWDMARNARMRRFQLNTEKAYRYRLFDIPLLYCFYNSRDWTGCISEEDFEIIKRCDIDWPHYSPEEKEFLLEQKKQLVEDYGLFLEYKNSFG